MGQVRFATIVLRLGMMRGARCRKDAWFGVDSIIMTNVYLLWCMLRAGTLRISSFNSRGVCRSESTDGGATCIHIYFNASLAHS